MAKPKINLSNNFTQLVTEFNNLSLDVGDQQNLNTPEDSDIVGAINSLYALIDSDLDFRSKISVNDAGGDGSVSYNSTTGVITYTGPVVRSFISVNDAGGDGSISYNSTTGVITYTGPSPSEVRAHVSATSASGDGSISYNSTTGVITYTGPSPSEVRAHLSAGTAITFDSSGEIAVTDGSIDTTQLTDDAVSRAKLKDEVSLQIFDSSGTALKTLYGAGS